MEDGSWWIVTLLWIIGPVTLGLAVFYPLLEYRFTIAKMVHRALCRGEDYEKYCVHLPLPTEMASKICHWNKWGVGAWMRWVDRNRRYVKKDS